MGLHGTQGVVDLDVVVALTAGLHIKCLESQADNGISVSPQDPLAASVVGVWAVGEAWCGKAGDLALLGMQRKTATICTGQKGWGDRGAEMGWMSENTPQKGKQIDAASR